MEMIRRPHGEYRPSRRKICVPGRLLAEGEVLRVLLLDISRDGAKVSLSHGILPGTAVELRVSGSTVPALVQWSKERTAGLRFLERLGRATLVALEGRDPTDDLFG